VCRYCLRVDLVLHHEDDAVTAVDECLTIINVSSIKPDVMPLTLRNSTEVSIGSQRILYPAPYHPRCIRYPPYHRTWPLEVARYILRTMSWLCPLGPLM
jgi:hypothetical protein